MSQDWKRIEQDMDNVRKDITNNPEVKIIAQNERILKKLEKDKKKIDEDMRRVNKDFERIMNGNYKTLTTQFGNFTDYQKQGLKETINSVRQAANFSNIEEQEDYVPYTGAPDFTTMPKTVAKRESGKKAPAKKRQAFQKKEVDPQSHISENYRGGLSEAYVKLKEENQKLTERAIAAELQLALVLAPQPTRWERMKLAWKAFSWKEYSERAQYETGQMVVRAMEKLIGAVARFF